MSVKSHFELWNECCAELRKLIGDEAFGFAFADVISYSLEDGVLSLKVPSETYGMMIDRQYAAPLKEAI